MAGTPGSAPRPLDAPVAEKLSMAVQFMHTAAPIRRLPGPAAASASAPASASASRDLREFGLDDGSLVVRLWTAASLEPRLVCDFNVFNFSGQFFRLFPILSG